MATSRIQGGSSYHPSWHQVSFLRLRVNVRLLITPIYSVALSGPAVFQFTAPSAPSRHREILAIFRGTTPSDPSIAPIPDSELGSHLFETIARFLDNLGVPRGLQAVGYTSADVARLSTLR